MRSERPTRLDQGGFTLIELIIALFLGALIIAPITMWVFVAIANSEQTNRRNQELAGGALLANYLKADMDMASFSKTIPPSKRLRGTQRRSPTSPCPNSPSLGTRSWHDDPATTEPTLLLQTRTRRITGETQAMHVEYTRTIEHVGASNESYTIWRRTCRAATNNDPLPLESEERVATGLLLKTKPGSTAANPRIKVPVLAEFAATRVPALLCRIFRCAKTVMSGSTQKNCNQIAATIIGAAGDVVRIQASRGVANTYPDEGGERDAARRPARRAALSRQQRTVERPGDGPAGARTPSRRGRSPGGRGARARRPVSRRRRNAPRAATSFGGGSSPRSSTPAACRRAPPCRPSTTRCTSTIRRSPR